MQPGQVLWTAVKPPSMVPGHCPPHRPICLLHADEPTKRPMVLIHTKVLVAILTFHLAFLDARVHGDTQTW